MSSFLLSFFVHAILSPLDLLHNDTFSTVSNHSPHFYIFVPPLSLSASLLFTISITVSSSQFPALVLSLLFLHAFPLSFYLSQRLVVKNSMLAP